MESWIVSHHLEKVMKRILVLFAIMTLADCIKAQDQLIKANNLFAVKIYKGTLPDTGNYFISPFSLHIAIAIANEGARSSTRQQMDELLTKQDIVGNIDYRGFIEKATNLNDKDFKTCLEWSSNKEGRNTLFMANSIWINDKLPVDPDFEKNIQDVYQAQQFSFSKSNIDRTNQKIDHWVSDKTHQRIKEVPHLTDDVLVSILNVIYFLGEWESPFEIDKTTENKFYTLSKEKIRVSFMKNQTQFLYYEDVGVQGIQLPYKCNQFSMTVVLPRHRQGLPDFEKKLTAEYLKNIKQSMIGRDVILSLPKFKIQSDISPVEALKRLGCDEMFSDNADFSGISSTRLKISRITHQTFIEVNETKTEAAAVTKVDMVITGASGDVNREPEPPKIFNADHPFFFFITDERTGAIIFTGRVMRP